MSRHPNDDPTRFPPEDPADRTVTFDVPDGRTIPVELPPRGERRRTTEIPTEIPTEITTEIRTDLPGESSGEHVAWPPPPMPARTPEPAPGSGAETAVAGHDARARGERSGQRSGSADEGSGLMPGAGRTRDRLAALGVLALVCTALPAIALVLPNTSLNVLLPARDALGLDDAGLPGLIRAAGLTLPALLLAVPVAAVSARRFSPRLVLLIGLVLLLGGLGAARLAGSVPMMAGGRVAQGVGAGVVLPAVLVLVWERRSRALAAVWAGTLVAALLVAMPLALQATPLPDAGTPDGDWRVAFGPYPGVAAAALAAAAACMAIRSRAPLAAPRQTERGQLLLPAVPAAGFAFLAVVTTYGWSPGAQLVVAGIAMVALIGLAVVGGKDAATGSPLGCAVVMVTAGLLTYPLAGPLAGLAGAAATLRGAEGGAGAGAEGGTPGDPRLYLVPFVIAGVAALAGALATVRMSRDAARSAVLGGHGLVIVAVLVCLATDVASSPWTLAAPMVPLGAGLGMALAASLRGAGVGAALFGLTLAFPAVLVGQLLVLALQAAQIQRLRPVNGPQQLYGLTAGFRVWLVTAGVLAVVLAAVCGRVSAARRRTAHAEGRRRSENPGNLLA
ncbi:hypothetical protein [Spirillospora sp. NPDC047279]|uniref:hypothetical protein n=1 Tax=Spirillospora sp. NPDC047279 TaxID=3155478 RepID=UPI0033D9C5A3